MKFIRYFSLISLIIFCLPMFYSYSQNEDTLSPGEHYAVINGVKLWYLVRGEGPVLLFHPGGAGWGGDASPYIETLKPLEKERTVVYLEPHGIGHSERLSDSTAYSMEKYVEEKTQKFDSNNCRNPWDLWWDPVNGNYEKYDR